MTKTPDLPPYEPPDTFRLEMKARSALKLANIELDLPTAAALLTIAVDHFADHPPEAFLGLCGRLQACSLAALEAGALCPRCRAERAVIAGERQACAWCAS
jgi:hypothetical protein